MNVPPSVTCTERVRMNAVFGLLFIFGGDAIMLYSVLNNDSVNFGMLFACICGIAAIVLGFYYICCFLNKKITVSDEGVVYTSWMAKRQSYAWDQVSVLVSSGSQRLLRLRFDGKRVKFYGYANNAQALYDYLLEHERYDDDTMRVLHRIEEEAAERERQLRLEEEVDAAFWDED